MLTWKMVIKYWKGLFGAEDSILFDETLNWGLYYWHEDWLFFGMDKIYDKEYEYEKTREYNELKEKFFHKANQNINQDEKQKSIKDFKAKFNIGGI